MTDEKIQLWSDGGGVNPGPSGYAAVLVYRGVVRIVGGFLPDGTNNMAETMGAVLGLQTIKPHSDVSIFTDSSYVVYGIKRILFRKPLLESHTDLWELARAAIRRHRSIEIQRIKGHSGVLLNEAADLYAGDCARTQAPVDVRMSLEELLKYIDPLGGNG